MHITYQTDHNNTNTHSKFIFNHRQSYNKDWIKLSKSSTKHSAQLNLNDPKLNAPIMYQNLHHQTKKMNNQMQRRVDQIPWEEGNQFIGVGRKAIPYALPNAMDSSQSAIRHGYFFFSKFEPCNKKATTKLQSKRKYTDCEYSITHQMRGLYK